MNKNEENRRREKKEEEEERVSFLFCYLSLFVCYCCVQDEKNRRGGIGLEEVSAAVAAAAVHTIVGTIWLFFVLLSLWVWLCYLQPGMEPEPCDTWVVEESFVISLYGSFTWLCGATVGAFGYLISCYICDKNTFQVGWNYRWQNVLLWHVTKCRQLLTNLKSPSER